VSSVDLHPEELIDRARRGAISVEETARLRAHLAGCSACRFEHLLADDCARAAEGDGSPAGDAVVWARVQRRARRAVHAGRGAFTSRGAWRRRLPARLVYASAAVFVFTAAVAAATTAVRRVWPVGTGPEVETSAETRAGRRATAAPRVEVAELATASPAELPANEAAAETAIVPSSTPSSPSSPSSRSRARVHVAAPAESPAELFARANAARRAGHTREAARFYQQLQREFPGSSEELVARVTLGRWMLDRLHDPAGALARFDSYLANPVHTALREEALIGRALALGRLGRRTEERAAWTAFLTAFPGSVYAERAHGRLEALR
jgi:hypothetical protein